MKSIIGFHISVKLDTYWSGSLGVWISKIFSITNMSQIILNQFSREGCLSDFHDAALTKWVAIDSSAIKFLLQVYSTTELQCHSFYVTFVWVWPRVRSSFTFSPHKECGQIGEGTEPGLEKTIATSGTAQFLFWNARVLFYKYCFSGRTLDLNHELQNCGGGPKINCIIPMLTQQ